MDEDEEDVDEDQEDDELSEATLRAQELQTEVEKRSDENERLRQKVEEQLQLIETLRSETSRTPPTAGTPTRVSMPSSRGGVGTGGVRTNSSQGGRRGSTQAPAPPAPSKAEFEMGRVIDDAAERIVRLSSHDKPPNAAEWSKMKTELKEIYQRMKQARST
jgi:hypothetical protein